MAPVISFSCWISPSITSGDSSSSTTQQLCSAPMTRRRFRFAEFRGTKLRLLTSRPTSWFVLNMNVGCHPRWWIKVPFLQKIISYVYTQIYTKVLQPPRNFFNKSTLSSPRFSRKMSTHLSQVPPNSSWISDDDCWTREFNDHLPSTSSLLSMYSCSQQACEFTVMLQ